MFITGKLTKKSPYRAFVYPYILVIGFLGLLWIINSMKGSQLISIYADSSILQHQSRNMQQQFLTMLEATLKNNDLNFLQNWTEEHRTIYNDLNGDGLTDSLFLVETIGISGSVGDVMVCHYLLKSSEWGNHLHPVTTIPLETNLSKSIHVLPNRYCLSPKIGLLYKVNTLQGCIVSCKKISLQHSIE